MPAKAGIQQPPVSQKRPQWLLDCPVEPGNDNTEWPMA
jgi:hypothetical protein